MSMEAVRSWEKHSRTEGTAFVVGKQLAFYAEQRTDLAWPSNKALAQSCRLSERQVQRALRELELTGEIVEQARSHGRRRVYIVTPQLPSQAPLFHPEGDTHVTQEGGFVTQALGDIQGLEGDTHAHAGRNPKNQKQNHTPLGPPGGGALAAPDLLRELHPAGQTPRVSVCVERVAPARRRRSRRLASEPVVASGRCPLHELTDSAASDRVALEEHWHLLASRLRERIGESTFEVWFADAHLHRLDSGLTLAIDPHRLGWVPDRFGAVIAAAAGVDVEMVACAGALR